MKPDAIPRAKVLGVEDFARRLRLIEEAQERLARWRRTRMQRLRRGRRPAP